MKKEFIWWIVFGSGIVISFGLAFVFRETQKNYFNKIKMEHHSLHSNLKKLKDDLAFMNNNHEQLNFLMEKGWFIPKNRLIGGEILEELQGSLNEIRYTFEPENIKMIKEISFKVTAIVIEVGAVLENDIYNFIDQLLEKFPGILIPRELMFVREQKVNEKNLHALRQNEFPNFIKGKLVFDWVAMDDENDKK